MRPNARSIRCMLAWSLFVAALGCAQSRSDCDESEGERDVSPLGGTSVTDHYFKLQATKNAPVGEYFTTFPIPLWIPFTIELSGGLYDPNHDDLTGGSFDVDVQSADTNSPSSQFHSMTVTPLAGGGLTVEAESSLDMDGFVGSQDFPGAKELDFRFEASGGLLVFKVRAKGDPSFVTLGAVALVTQSGPLVAGVGVIDLGNKCVVGFDKGRVLADALGPGPFSEKQIAAAAIRLAGLFGLEALYAVDGPAPDLASAADLLDTALTDLDQARGFVNSLPSSKARKKAKDLLSAARKKLRASIRKVDDGNERAAYSKLKKSLDKQFHAILLLDPL